MFHFFPNNYRWSQAALRILFTGGSIGEVGPAVVELADASIKGDDAAWNRVWLHHADQLASRAEAQADAGHATSARDSWLRAYAYYQWASAFQEINDPARHETHQRSLRAFGEFARLTVPPIERVEVPYEGASYPAWLVPPAAPTQAPYPVAIYLPGWESTKEQGIAFGLEVARRGIGVLLCDGPGIGEAVLFRGLVNRHDYEVPVTAALEYLAERPDVDAARIGVVGSSMGGYRAARAAAYEPRLAAAVAWGAIWDFGAIWQRNLAEPGSTLPTTMTHALHVMGGRTLDHVTELMEPWTLEGHAERIACPLLVVHGERDVQIPLDDAVRLYRQASSPMKELKVFTVEEGGAAHCQNDNRILAHEYIGDWFSDVLVENRQRTGMVGIEDSVAAS
jgi:dipeptidyl aminopeptidase/acylaminoacyl peptidase